MAYLLDANVFIQARNLHYGFDICPGFWDWLDLAAEDGRVRSIQQIRDELVDEELTDWGASRDTLFYRLDAGVAPSLRVVAEWTRGAGYEPAAVATFFQDADYFLVAAALAEGHTVVTHEVPSNSTKKIKIPDACLAVGVHFMTPFTMLKRESVQFVLGAA